MAKDFTIDDVEAEIKASKRRASGPRDTDAYDVSSTVNLIKKYQSQNKKGIESVTKQLSIIAKEQAATAKVLRTKEIGYAKGVKEVENSMAGILKRLGFVVDDVSKTAKKILVTTAVTTKDAVTQMARNMNADFQFNKANYVGMLVAKASPIFGYFASKFMETNVFSAFTERIKENFRDAAEYGADQLKKKGIFGLFNDTIKLLLKLPVKAIALPFKILGALMKAPFKLLKGAKNLFFGRKDLEEDIPHLQKGGYVKKTGMVNVHAGEVVTPLKGFMSKFDVLIKEIRITRVALAGLGGEFAARFGARLLKGPIGKTLVYGYGMLKKWGGDTLGKMKSFVIRLFGFKGPSVNTVLADLKKYKDNPSQLAAVGITYIYEVLDNIKNSINQVKGSYFEGIAEQAKEKAEQLKQRLKARKLSNLDIMNPYAAAATGMGGGIGGEIAGAKGKALDQYNALMAGMRLKFGKKGPTQEQQWGALSQSIADNPELNALFGIQPKVPKKGMMDKIKGKASEMKKKAGWAWYDLTKPFGTREQKEEKALANSIESALSTSLFGKKKAPKQGFIATLRKSYEEFRDKDKREKIKASAYRSLKEAIQNPKSVFDKVKGVFSKGLTKFGMFIMLFLQKFAIAPFKIALAPFYLMFKAVKFAAPIIIGALTAIGRMKIGVKGIGNLLKGTGAVVKYAGKFALFLGKFAKVLPAVGLIIAGIEGFALLVKGFLKRKEWFGIKPGEKVDWSKTFLSILGAVLGGTKSGAAGAKSGAIRYAMIGAGLGIVGGPLGMIGGALLGGAVGGILGAIGGEKIAKILVFVWEELKIQFMKAWKTFTWPFKVVWDVAIKARDWIIEKIRPITDVVFKFIQPAVEWVSSKLDWVTNLFRKLLKIFAWLGSTKGIDQALEEQKKEKERVKTMTGGEAYAKIGEKIAETAYNAKNPKKYHTGGLARGEQFAILQDKEVVVPRNVVLKAAKSGVPPEEIRSGAAIADKESTAALIEKVTAVVEKISKIVNAPQEMAKAIVGGAMGAARGAFKAIVGKMGFGGGVGPQTGFGWLSRMFESGGAGPGAISSGKGDFGGKSYGLYQFASRTGGASAFVNSNPWLKSSFSGLAPGSSAFDAKWKSMAADPNFASAQHSYVKKKYLDPLLKKVQASTGLDLSKRHPVVLEELLSTAVQYGPGTSVVARALQGATNNITDAEILARIGKYKYETVSSHFKSSSPAVQSSVARRFQKETGIALANLPGGLQDKAVQSLQHAQTGGYISKNGPIFAHAGEVIGPLNDIKDVVKDAIMSRGDLAKKQAKESILQNEMLTKSNEGFKTDALDVLKQGNAANATMLNVISNNVSSAVSSKNTGQSNSRDTAIDPLLNQIISGDFV